MNDPWDCSALGQGASPKYVFQGLDWLRTARAKQVGRQDPAQGDQGLVLPSYLASGQEEQPVTHFGYQCGCNLYESETQPKMWSLQVNSPAWLTAPKLLMSEIYREHVFIVLT